MPEFFIHRVLFLGFYFCQDLRHNRPRFIIFMRICIMTMGNFMTGLYGRLNIVVNHKVVVRFIKRIL